MVIRHSSARAPVCGSLIAELLLAMTLAVCALLPVFVSIAAEKRLAKSYYHRAVAVEIVDGEMEVLLAGEWRTFAPGTHEYPLPGGAITNLLSGKLLLTVQSNWVRLEWRPEASHQGGPVVREARAK